MKRNVYQILLLSGGFMLVVGLVWLLIRFSGKSEVAIKEPVQIDAVVDNFSQDAREGRIVYNIHCASCHYVDRDYIGPDLQTIQLEKFSTWISEPSVGTNSKSEFGIEYHRKSFGGLIKQEKLDLLLKFIGEY